MRREPLYARKHRVSCDSYPPNITLTQQFHCDLQSLPCKSQSNCVNQPSNWKLGCSRSNTHCNSRSPTHWHRAVGQLIELLRHPERRPLMFTQPSRAWMHASAVELPQLPTHIDYKVKFCEANFRNKFLGAGQGCCAQKAKKGTVARPQSYNGERQTSSMRTVRRPLHPLNARLFIIQNTGCSAVAPCSRIASNIF